MLTKTFFAIYFKALLIPILIGLLILPGVSGADDHEYGRNDRSKQRRASDHGRENGELSEPKAIPIKQWSYVPGQVLVELEIGVSQRDQKRMKDEVGIEKTIRKLGSTKDGQAGDTYLYKLKPGQSIKKALAKIKANKNVKVVQLNHIRKLSFTPNDPYFSSQWGLYNTGQTGGTADADIDAPEAWDIEDGNSNTVTVAVIDTGVDQTHPDLSSQIWQNTDEIPGNSIDDDSNGYVDDAGGYNFAGISQLAFNAYWEVGRYNTYEFAQSIKGTGRPLSHVGLYIAKKGSPSGNIEIFVRESLTGPNLRSASITPGEVSTTYNEIYKSLDSSITLNSGQTYYIVFRATAASMSKYYKIIGNSSSISGYIPDPYRDGIRHWYDGSTWQSDSSNDWFFHTNPNANPQDDNGHGTHVSGIVSAAGNNTVGGTGVSFGADIMSLKAGDSAGSLATSDIIDAISYAADNGADVINMSFGGSENDPLEQQAVDYAYNSGVTLFASSGNTYDTEMQYPPGHNNVVGVGATTDQDTKASFSTYNSSVDLSAPGSSIYSTMPTYPVGLNSEGYLQDYDYLSGTSMASPMAAGLAALVLSRNPSYTPLQVQQVMEANADDKGVAGRDDSFGHGRINAFRTLSNVPAPDTSAPVTGLASVPTTPTGDAGWYISDTTITLTPNETATTYYNWDGSSDITYTSAFSAPEGSHDLSYYSIDTAGNTETPANTATVKVDTGAPIDPSVASSSHTTGTPSADNTVDILWPAIGAPGGATDTISGVDGYSVLWDTSSTTTPDNIKDLEENTTSTVSPSLSDGSNHYVHLRTVDNAGNWTSTVHLGPFVIDTEVPSTILDATGTIGGGGWFISDTTITLSSSEPGVTYYSINGGLDQFYSGAFAADEGNNLYTYYSVDTAGNTETPANTTMVKVDTEVPSTTLDVTGTIGDNGWFTGDTSIILTSDEPGPTYYSVNSGADQLYTGSFLAPEGTNEIGYYSVDTAGNTETPANTATVKVDKSDPSDPIVSSSSHTTDTLSGDNTIDIGISGATDSISGVDGFSVSWSKDTTALPDTTMTLEETSAVASSSSLADGFWYFNLRTKDNAGNWTSTVHTGPFQIESIAPTTDFETIPATPNGANGWYTTNPTTITLTPNKVATTYYSWDSTAAFAIGTVVPASKEGTHTLYYFSVDLATNTETVKSSEIKIDSILPIDPNVTSSTPAKDVWTNDNTVELNFSGATDASSGVDGFSILWSSNTSDLPDQTKNIEETANFTVSPALANGNQYFHLSTLDNAGNWTSTVHFGPFKIDKTKPTGSVAINSGGTYTKSTAVTLNLSALDGAGSGLSHMRFKKDGGTWTGWETYKTTKSWKLPATNGTKKVWVRYKDKAGNQSDAYSDTIFLDTRKPTVKVSAPRLSTDQTKNTRFRISWKGSDAAPASKIATYDVQKRVNRGSWKTFISNTTKRAAYVRGKPGLNFKFRVRGEDRAGNVGKYSKVKRTIVPYDNNQLIAWRSGFGLTRKSTKSNYFKNTIRYSKAAGDRITYKFSGNGVYLVTTKAKRMSKVRVLINGRYIKTVNAYSAKKGYRRVVFKKFWSKKKTRKITFVNIGNKPLSHIDGLGVRK